MASCVFLLVAAALAALPSSVAAERREWRFDGDLIEGCVALAPGDGSGRGSGAPSVTAGLTDQFWGLLNWGGGNYFTTQVDDDDDDDFDDEDDIHGLSASPRQAEARAFVCRASVAADGSVVAPVPVEPGASGVPRGLRGRGPAWIEIKDIVAGVPCESAANARATSAGAGRLGCPAGGRKAIFRVEGEVTREGLGRGAAEATFSIGMVGDLRAPRLVGGEAQAALLESTCLRETFCRVPLHAPPEVTVRVDEQRTYYPLHSRVPHVTYAGRLGEARELPEGSFYYASFMNQIIDLLGGDTVANITGPASFTVNAGPYGACGSRRRGNLRQPAVIEAELAAAEATLEAEGICDFQWADSLRTQPQGEHRSFEDACTAALCVSGGGANATVHTVSYHEYGDRCSLWQMGGEAEALFAVTVSAEGEGSNATPLAAALFAAGQALPLSSLVSRATAYSVHRGHGVGNSFWEETGGAASGSGRASTGNGVSIRARAHFGQALTSENAYGPSTSSLDGAFLVCGADHRSMAPRTRLETAPAYWEERRARGHAVANRQEVPPGAGSVATSIALREAGGRLNVPTTIGHGGANAFWAWQPKVNGSVGVYGRRPGALGQCRRDLFWHSVGRTDEVCAAGFNRTLAAAFVPGAVAIAGTNAHLAKQPAGVSADLNFYAHHPETAAFLRGHGPPGVTDRALAGALPRPAHLPPRELYDESAQYPGLYLTRCSGSLGGLSHGGGQRLPFGAVHEDTRVGTGAEELAAHRSRFDVTVEVDDSWLHVDASDHHSARAPGTVYFLRLLNEGGPRGLSSFCMRHEDRREGRTADPAFGYGRVQLTYTTTQTTPVRLEQRGSTLPLRKRYRAVVQCDPSVGTFEVRGSRMDIEAGGTRAIVRFLAAVGGPAGLATPLDHHIRLGPPDRAALQAYLDATGQSAASAVERGDILATGTCSVTLFSDEPESRHVQVGRPATLACGWRPQPAAQHEQGPAHVLPPELDCSGFPVTDPRCASAWGGLLGAAILAALVLAAVVVFVIFNQILETRRVKSRNEAAAALGVVEGSR